MEFKMAFSLSNSTPLWPWPVHALLRPRTAFWEFAISFLLHWLWFRLTRFYFVWGLLFCFRFGMTISSSLIYSSHSSSESWSLKCSRSGSLWLSHFFKGTWVISFKIFNCTSIQLNRRWSRNDKETINSKSYRPLYYTQPFYRSNRLKEVFF